MRTSQKKERDETICRLYVDGMTTDELSRAYHVSHERIRQILRHYGVQRGQRKISDERDEYLGVNLTEAVKDALRTEARLRNCSMSELTSEWISSRLTYCGYIIGEAQ